MAYLDKAEELMQSLKDELVEPPFGPPTKRFAWTGPLVDTSTNLPKIRREGRDMPEFHPILTTDFFEYGTTANRLDQQGAAVEMGDAALGLAVEGMANPPRWLVVRNMSDPLINGDLPATEYKLNQQTTWAVGYYTAYGYWTSVMGALASWAVVAGFDGA